MSACNLRNGLIEQRDFSKSFYFRLLLDVAYRLVRNLESTIDADFICVSDTVLVAPISNMMHMLKRFSIYPFVHR